MNSDDNNQIETLLRNGLDDEVPAEVEQEMRRQLTELRHNISGLENTPRKRFRRVPAGILGLAVAAALLLAVGLWPDTSSQNGNGGSGRVYALSDIPGLLRSAKVLHLHEWTYIPTAAEGPSNLRRRKISTDYWLDMVNGRWHIWTTNLGLSDGVPPSKEMEQATYHFLQQVCDGDYKMALWYDAPLFEEDPSVAKTGEFARLTPFMRMLKLRDYYPWVTAEAATFARSDVLSRFAKIGEEELDNISFEIWAAEDNLPHSRQKEDEGANNEPDRLKTVVWLSPTSGIVGRLEHWIKGASTDGLWVLNTVIDKVERDIEPPPGIFETVPPSEYSMKNSKENAPLMSIASDCSTLGFGNLEIRLHIQIPLEDGTILYAWSSWEENSTASQVSLFENLTPGGPQPKLPIELQALAPTNSDCDLIYTGRHLAWTQKDGRCYEWSLFVPQRPLPSPQDRCAKFWDFRYAVNSDSIDAGEREPLGFPVVGSSVYPVGDPAEFDELVLGGMADLSDSGVAPDYVNYEYVMDLCEQIRSSLSEP